MGFELKAFPQFIQCCKCCRVRELRSGLFSWLSVFLSWFSFPVFRVTLPLCFLFVVVFVFVVLLLFCFCVLGCVCLLGCAARRVWLLVVVGFVTSFPRVHEVVCGGGVLFLS